MLCTVWLYLYHCFNRSVYFLSRFRSLCVHTVFSSMYFYHSIIGTVFWSCICITVFLSLFLSHCMFIAVSIAICIFINVSVCICITVMLSLYFCHCFRLGLGLEVGLGRVCGGVGMGTEAHSSGHVPRKSVLCCVWISGTWSQPSSGGLTKNKNCFSLVGAPPRQTPQSSLTSTALLKCC